MPMFPQRRHHRGSSEIEFGDLSYPLRRDVELPQSRHWSLYGDETGAEDINLQVPAGNAAWRLSAPPVRARRLW